MMKRRCLAAVAFAVALCALPAAGSDRKQLPELRLTSADASLAATAELPSSGKWLLVYVREKCRRCDELLAHIDRQPRAEAERIVIVVGAPTADALRTVSAKYPNLSAARWYADADGSAQVALKLRGAPFVLGMNDMSVNWTLAGSLPQEAELESVLFTWLQEQK